MTPAIRNVKYSKKFCFRHSIMLDFLRSFAVFAFVQAVLTAALMYVYSKTLVDENKQAHKAFFKTLVAGLGVGALLAYFANRPEPVLTAPFLNVVPQGIAAAVP